IYIIDNDSSYPPLLEYYHSCPHTVLPLHENVGRLAPWETGIIRQYCADRYYVLTDPDIIPIQECPTDAISRFRDLLDKYPDRDKAGFGLKIDDLPTHYRFAAEVRAWEGQFWDRELEPGVFDAPIDTTFALYRAGAIDTSPSVRTGEPYVARHTPWYTDTANPDPEELYYREHTTSDLNYYDREVLPQRFTKLLVGEVERYQAQARAQRQLFADLSARADALEAELTNTQGQLTSVQAELRSTQANLNVVSAESTVLTKQLAALERSRAVRLVKLAHAAREVLREKGPLALAKQIAQWLVGQRGYHLRDVDRHP
ncbi:MAG: hypothetical protein ACRDHE_08700, partial [Ktedonobacterales bacterium]